MSLTNFNDNINLAAPKALDQRTGKFSGGLWIPYVNVAEANLAILSPYRHRGLTVLISIDGVATEYWYRDGIADIDLIPKGIATSGTVFTEDTPSLFMSGDGSVGSPLSGDVQLSKIANNSIKLLSDGLFSFNTIKQGIVYGGIKTWLGNYDYEISAAGYYINGVFYTAPKANFTLSAPDGTFNRIDTFIADDTGSFSVLEGIPSDNPAQAALDPATQIQLSFAIVETGTTEPTIEQECIYIDDAEWTSLSSSVRINKASTSSPCNGTKSVEGTAPVAGDNIKFTRGTTFNPLTDHTILKFSIRSKGAFGGNGNNKRKLVLQFRNGVTNVGGSVNILNGSYGFDDTNITDCQNIAIPLIDFAFPTVPVIDNLLITVGGVGSILGFRLDDICFQGVPLPTPTPSIGTINITYAQLVIAITNHALIPNQPYRITDYATKHYIVDNDGVQYTGTIITGVVEPLIVIAATNNTLYTEAKSELHPEDIIHYDWNPANWLRDLSFAAPLNFIDDPTTATIVAGFKGVIFFRHDTKLDNYMGYDFRNCKFRRWKQNTPAWDSAITYNINNVFVSYGGFLYKSITNANLNNIPASGSSFWVQLVDLSLTEYWNGRPDSSGLNIIPSDPLDFIDVKTFNENGLGTYSRSCSNNHIDSFRDNFTDYNVSATILSNNVFFLKNLDTKQIYNNVMGAGSINNTIFGNFNNNVFQIWFRDNRIGGNMNGNTCGSNFAYNILKGNIHNNDIGSAFLYNNLGDGLSQDNLIGNFFYGNILYGFNQSSTTILFGGNVGSFISDCKFGVTTIGNRFKSMIVSSFGSQFNSNTFGTVLGCTFGEFIQGITAIDGFSLNVLHNGVQGINFSTATLVYNYYTKEIIKTPNGSHKLRYIDNAGAQQIVDPLT